MGKREVIAGEARNIGFGKTKEITHCHSLNTDWATQNFQENSFSHTLLVAEVDPQEESSLAADISV